MHDDEKKYFPVCNAAVADGCRTTTPENQYLGRLIFHLSELYTGGERHLVF